jgi:hypothetical protein
MICSICGSPNVTWRGPLSALTHTGCADCGAVNSQVAEFEGPLEDDESELTSYFDEKSPKIENI